MWSYDLLGLAVRSEFRLDAEPGASSSEERCDVRLDVRLGARFDASAFGDGELVARLGEGADGYEVRRTRGVFLARFGDHTALAVDPEARAVGASGDPDALAYVVPNAGLALYLLAHGALVLHASAIAWKGGAHALVGASQAGKTTLAAVLCVAGAALVTDDTLRVRVGASSVSAWGGTRRLRLRPSSAEIARDLPAAARSASADGRVVLTLPAGGEGELRLESLCFPAPDRGLAQVELAPLSRSSALERLLGAARLRGLRERGLLARQFHDLGELARAVPAFEARVPWGPPFERSSGEALLGALERARGSG